MPASVRRWLTGLGLLLAFWLVPVVVPGDLPLTGGSAQAQVDSYPNRPIRLIVSIGPGSGADLMCRTLGEQISAQFGQPVVVENKPGGDGVVAAQAMLSAPADGYTFMLLSPGTLIINTLNTTTPPYRVVDFKPLVGMVRVTGVVAVAPGARFQTLSALVESARQTPGKLTLGTYGTIYRISAQMLERKLAAEFNHVNYKGFGPASTDLVGGAIDTGLIDAGGAAPMIKSGRLRGLAVTSKERLASLPDVPTLRELGIRDYDPPIWVGMGVRAQTPEPIARKLEAALQQAMTSTAWLDLLARQGNLEPWSVDSQSFARAITEDTEFFSRVVSPSSGSQ